MMRWSIWFLGMLCAVAAGARATDKDVAAKPMLGHYITESSIVYPLEVDGWSAGEEHRYELAELGASVAFSDAAHEQRWMTVYFYPAGPVPDEGVKRLADQTLEEIAGMTRTANGYDRVDIQPVHEFVFDIGEGESKRALKAFSTSISFEKHGKRYSSAMVLLVRDLYYVKTRLSMPEDEMDADAVRALLERQTAGLVRASAFYSTGGCWNPMPIVARERLDPKATGAVAKSEVDGRVVAIAYVDRVEALSEKDAGSRVLQRVASNLTGRWPFGCYPPEELAPQVPKGMRELRFEYPPPRDGSDGTTPPIRQRRSGRG